MSFVVRSGLSNKTVMKSSLSIKAGLHDSILADTFTVLQWNIDGLGEPYRTMRTTEVAKQVLESSSDVVMLQEVVVDTLPLLESLLGSQYVVAGTAPPGKVYFAISFLHRRHKLLEHRREEFRGPPEARGMMGRDVSLLKALIHSREVVLINTHLESMKEHGPVRVLQLTDICSRMVREGMGAAICAGDLNMRDTEQAAAFHNTNTSNTLVDAYVFFKKPKEAYGTWIMPNKESVKCRFDRCYHNGRGIELVPCDDSMPMGLLGRRKLASCGNMRPSDHIGIKTRFKFTGKQPTATATAATAAAASSTSTAIPEVYRTLSSGNSIDMRQSDCEDDDEKILFRAKNKDSGGEMRAATSSSNTNPNPNPNPPPVKHSEGDPSNQREDDGGERAKRRRLCSAAAEARLKHLMSGSEGPIPSLVPASTPPVASPSDQPPPQPRPAFIDLT